MSGPRNVDLNPLVLSHFSRNNKKKKKTAMKCDRVLQKFFLLQKLKIKKKKEASTRNKGRKKERLWKNFGGISSFSTQLFSIFHLLFVSTRIAFLFHGISFV